MTNGRKPDDLSERIAAHQRRHAEECPAGERGGPKQQAARRLEALAGRVAALVRERGPLTREQICAAVGCSFNTMRKACLQGGLVSFRNGSRFVYWRAA
jgi:hypothetical protein